MRRELAELKDELRNSKSEVERAEISREIKMMVLRINTMFATSRNQVSEI